MTFVDRYYKNGLRARKNKIEELNKKGIQTFFFKIEFYGKLVGCYIDGTAHRKIKRIVEAENIEDAQMAAYDTHDHVGGSDRVIVEQLERVPHCPSCGFGSDTTCSPPNCVECGYETLESLGVKND